MILPLLLSSMLLATTRINTSISVEGGGKTSVKVTQSINAQSSKTISQTREVRREIRGEVKETVVENRCEQVTNRVNSHLRAGEVVKDLRARIHQGVVKRLQALFAKLDGKDCDITTAKANLATWEAMIDEYASLFNSWLNALHDVQNKVCQENATDYRASLQAVHDKRKLAQDKKREISQYYINTLKPSVRQLRTSCRTSPAPEAAQ